MKKVCILTTAHPRFDTRVFFREARSLAEQYDTTLLVADGQPAEDCDGVKIRPIIERKPKNRPERMFRFTRIIYKEALSLKADIYHFHDTELFFVALRLKRRGKTVIYDAHESIADTILDRDYLPRPVLILLSGAMYLFEQYTSRRMDAVVTVTPFLRDRFLRWGCNVRLVCNFPVLEDFAEGTTPMAERENCACYAGAQIDQSRGVYEMAQAVQKTDIPLHLFGRIPAVVQEYMDSVDKAHRVILHGSVPHGELRRKLCHSRIGMVSEYLTGNSRNAYCIKLFEYMAAGMAVISADIPLWKELVDSVGCGLCVTPTDPSAVAEALAYLRDHPEEASEMGRRGRQAAEETYNWGTQRETLLDLYESLCK